MKGNIDIWASWPRGIDVREVDITPKHESNKCTSEVVLAVEYTCGDSHRISRYGYRCVHNMGHTSNHATPPLIWDGYTQVTWPQELELVLVLSALQGKPPTTALRYIRQRSNA